MTQEITDIIERNLDNLFDELDELAWDGEGYNEYIELEVLNTLANISEALCDAYNVHTSPPAKTQEHMLPCTYHFEAQSMSGATYKLLFGD